MGKSKKQTDQVKPQPLKANTYLKPMAFAVIGLIIGAGSMFFLTRDDYEVGAAGLTPAIQELRQKGYQLISPLLDCTQKSDSSYFSSTISLKKAIQKQLEVYPKIKASVYFRDLTNGPIVHVNGDFKYSPASLTKIPIMISYLKYAEDNPKILLKKLKYLKTPMDLEVAFKPKKIMEAGEEYTIEQLLNAMISDSDNGARGTLVADVFENAQGKRKDELAVPIDFYSEIFADLGLDSPDLEDPKMTAKQVASFFRILYNASYLDRKYSEFGLNILIRSTFNKGITQGLPSEVMVAHKFGEDFDGSMRSLHECGIVYYPKKPYILCVMTEGQDTLRQSKLIGEISKIVSDKH